MRGVTVDLQTKLKNRFKSLYGDNDPRIKQIATQIVTNTLLTEPIHRDETPAFGDVAIRQVAGEKDPSLAYAICIDAGVAHVYSRVLPAEMDLQNLYLFYKSTYFTNGTGNYDTLTFTLPTVTILDTEWPNQTVRVLGVRGIGAFVFPDETVFPEYPIERLILGEGDGVKTTFPVGCPFIKEGTARCFVGNNELSPEEFSFDYNSNCTDYRENYYTATMRVDGTHLRFGDLLSRAASSSKNYRDPVRWSFYESLGASGNGFATSCQIKQDTPIWIDLGASLPCNSMRIDNTRPSTTYLNNLVIEYSDDNENWTAVTHTRTDTLYSGTSYYAMHWTFPEQSARYWRIYIPGYTWTYTIFNENKFGTRDGHSYYATFFLGRTTLGLTLATPPASGEPVEVSYKLNIPYKTTNNILRLSCSITLQRGDGS